MKKHAVLVTILFTLAISLLSVSWIFWKFYKLNRQQYINHIFTKYSVITQIYQDHQQRQTSDTLLDANLAVYKMELIKKVPQAKKILKNAKILKNEGFEQVNSSFLFNKTGVYHKNIVTKIHATMMQYKRSIYFYMKSYNGSVLIKDDSLKTYSYINLLYAYSTIFMIISFSFVLVLQKLRPLIRLRKKIALFGDGDMNISFRTKNCDEIGLISNEMESAREKIQTLLESRTLFLRNLMHELKTPIAKGTIATQMLASQKQRDRFSSIFRRLESLVTEFAMIEEVTSLDDKRDFSEYRVVDIIDGAIDMAMVEREVVTVEVNCDTKIHANYKLYTTAIKNMIDNAMKYSSDQHICIRMLNGELCFENRGEKLAYPLSYYIEPFTKEHPSKNSFGLGLYLVDSILKAHSQVLAYEYENGVNRFIYASAV